MEGAVLYPAPFLSLFFLLRKEYILRPGIGDERRILFRLKRIERIASLLDSAYLCIDLSFSYIICLLYRQNLHSHLTRIAG